MSAIMSETLPTVISMGVVSRAVDTTMGGRGKRGGKGSGKRKRVERQFKVHEGPRGGKYIVHRGKKIYL